MLYVTVVKNKGENMNLKSYIIFALSTALIAMISSCGVKQSADGPSYKSKLASSKNVKKKNSANAGIASESEILVPGAGFDTQNSSYDMPGVQTKVPLKLDSFDITKGSSYGGFQISVKFPNDISNYGRVKIIAKPGNTAPNDCFDGVQVKDYQNVSSDATDAFEYVVDNQSLVYSFKVCIFSNVDSEIIQSEQIIENLIPHTFKILTGIDIRSGNSCKKSCENVGYTCVSIGTDGDAKNGVFHYSQGRPSQLHEWTKFITGEDGTRCKDFYGNDAGGGCDSTIDDSNVDSCYAASTTNCRCDL